MGFFQLNLKMAKEGGAILFPLRPLFMKLLVMVVSSYRQNNSFSLTTSFILMLYFCLVFRISSESQTTNQCCWRCWRQNSDNSCKCDAFPVCLLHVFVGKLKYF